MTKLHSAIHAFISSFDIISYTYDHLLPHQTDYERGVLVDEAPFGETLNGTPSLVSFLRSIEEERFSWRIGLKTTKGIIRVQYSVCDHGFRIEAPHDVKPPSLEIIEFTPITGSERIEVRTDGLLITNDLNIVKEDFAVELFQRFCFIVFFRKEETVYEHCVGDLI